MRKNKDKKKKQNNVPPVEPAERKEGIVLEALPGAHFKVKLETGEELMAHLAGKLRLYRIKILPGDKVTLELSPYDIGKGRIVYRKK
ncbi:translation initiation factor IF-1 [Candidatus Parcubacteria bacterium]|nr:translation initiation factor IF-1 [Candidatus Parcubacteria bacterium]